MNSLFIFLKDELERREIQRRNMLKFKARAYQEKILKEFENGQKYFYYLIFELINNKKGV